MDSTTRLRQLMGADRVTGGALGRQAGNPPPPPTPTLLEGFGDGVTAPIITHQDLRHLQGPASVPWLQYDGLSPVINAHRGIWRGQRGPFFYGQLGALGAIPHTRSSRSASCPSSVYLARRRKGESKQSRHALLLGRRRGATLYMKWDGGQMDVSSEAACYYLHPFVSAFVL